MKIMTTLCFIISLFFLVRAMHLLLFVKQKRSYPPAFWVKKQAMQYMSFGGIGLLCTFMFYVFF
ncbi:hypothetical protein CG478_010190 [Bacillus cytotoxicus]|uniref:A0A073KCG7 (Uncharacterized protein) n=1 Tax=Bacillus cytotoxicus TaxID=580165 RepID=A0AAX2CDM7_9BACI|nr:hypothetical protein CG483_005065 [Bacillus cytotoxicus]AWC31795.1 hypothetical protein CG482_004765 [Bacillus cytotoxicus]AWC35833.1 hypothetical protein CG481_004770 [Bacillus cytotoxicus]AWC40819.1 hypothetical protein CG480_010190 [Bacillus cytotoxicus]AWC43880.1 hypothetical protein CG479_004690 [Bacillus cytotoxicus]